VKRPLASLLILPGFVLAGLAFTWPLAAHFTRSLPAVFDPVDPQLQFFILGWDLHRLATGLPGVFDAPIFHPEPRTLTYMDHLLGEALLAAPVAATAGLAAAYNSLVLLSFALSGWAFYRLVRWLGVSRAGAFACGLLYVASPYRLSNLGNLNQLQTQLVPVALLLALRFAAKGKTRDLGWSAAVLAIQSYLGWYYAFHIAMACAILGLWLWHEKAPGLRPLPWVRLGLAAVAALLLMAPGAWPYWLQHSTLEGFQRTLGKAALYSADLVDYVRLNEENALARMLELPTGDLAYAVGVVATLLGIAGILSVRRGTTTLPNAALSATSVARAMGIVGLVSFVLSLGPILQVAGRRFFVPLPYAVLYFVIPGFTAMRAPGRFAGLVLIAVLVFAAWGYDSIRSRLAGGAARAAWFAGVVALSVVLAWSSPIPLVEPPRAEDMPETHQWLAQQPGDFAILELPMPASEAEEGERDARRQVWILYHGKRRIDGISGFSTPAHEAFRSLMQTFPDPEAVKALVEAGARYVVVRYGEFDPQNAGRVRADLVGVRELVPVFESGTDVVYAVVVGELMAARRR
jgi:hypothetical protein